MRNEPSAFDLWLQRDLRLSFGAVVRDPVPDTLLALVPPRLPRD